ncbi:metal ABC transporter solute-binding protein, Zn/Mn family [Streptomyces umbrinus]|uniref:metal ABC transporter solute-binding protein, Zn/Mn family n=1 Tax=Streptomyces umbrinus TaxID=67370 RepID=UPI003C302EE8
MRGHPRRTTTAALAATCALLTGVNGCSGLPSGSSDAELTVSTTTAIIADLVGRVGGDQVDVTSIVPHHGDPHSYEPGPGDAARVTEADAVFSNGLLLEEPGIMKMVHTNAPRSAPKIGLAEKLEQYGGTVMKLEEDLGLDVLWLGWAVEGRGWRRRLPSPYDGHDVGGAGQAAGVPHGHARQAEGVRRLGRRIRRVRLLRPAT